MVTKFHNVNGVICWGTTPLAEVDAEHLLALYMEEYRAATRAHDLEIAQRALDLHGDLGMAIIDARAQGRTDAVRFA